MVAPDAFAGIHGYFYIVIAAFCLFSAGLAHFYYVETAGHTLGEIAIAFGDQAFADGDVDVVGIVDLNGPNSEKRRASMVSTTDTHVANTTKMGM